MGGLNSGKETGLKGNVLFKFLSEEYLYGCL
jgi:hypothetical protein